MLFLFAYIGYNTCDGNGVDEGMNEMNQEVKGNDYSNITALIFLLFLGIISSATGIVGILISFGAFFVILKLTDYKRKTKLMMLISFYVVFLSVGVVSTFGLHNFISLGFQSYLSIIIPLTFGIVSIIVLSLLDYVWDKKEVYILTATLVIAGYSLYYFWIHALIALSYR